MDQFFEYLVPIVVFVLWALGQVFEKMRSGNNQDEPSPPNEEQQEDQARRIQEEIRRKIAERRRQNQGTAQADAPPALQQERPPPPPRPSPYSSPPVSGRGQVPRRMKPPPRPSQPPVYQEAPGASRPDIFAELAEQEERMRQTQRRADEARAQARERISRSTAKAEPKRRYSTASLSGASLRGDIIDTVRDPLAARKAILFSEILGTPVGQRRNGHIRPTWES